MKKEHQCQHYRQELERSQRRLTELQEQGVEALSRYDREIAYGGDDERAIQMSTWLVGNHIAYFTEKLTHCDEPVQQITLFEASLAPHDPASSSSLPAALEGKPE